MRYIIIPVLLLLAACNGQQPTTTTETLEQRQHAADYKLLRNMGFSDEKAKELMDRSENEADNKRAAARAAQRQEDISTVLAGACKNDPGLSYC